MKGRIVIAGVGPGNSDMMTRQAFDAYFEADVVVGGRRVLKELSRMSSEKDGKYPEKEFFFEYRAECILSFVKQDVTRHPGRMYFIAVSGDSGFFSGASSIQHELEAAGFEPEVFPGISSLSVLCAKAGVSWEDVFCVSAHGREVNIASCVRRHRKTFVLTGGNVTELMERLTEFGLGGVRVVVGEDLSYERERIYEATASEMASHDFQMLSSVLILNERANDRVLCGIDDNAFFRGSVPMTKREVRAVIMSHMRLREDSVVFDIGAGTGSVTIEAALAAWRGRVFAVEHGAEGQALIRENCRRFAADNVTVVAGSAPEVLTDLPAPDVVFIGGNGGRLEEIFDALCGAPNGEAVGTRDTKEQTDCERSVSTGAVGMRDAKEMQTDYESNMSVEAVETREVKGSQVDDKSSMCVGMAKTRVTERQEIADGNDECGTEAKSPGFSRNSGRNLRIVMTAVTLETVSGALALFEKYRAYDMEAVQISAVRARPTGKYHLFDAQNPVFLISGNFCRRQLK